MGDKIRFSNNDNDREETYEPTDSEDEYSEEEKELLAKVRKGRKRTDEGDKELMAFSDSDDDDDDDNEDGDASGDDDLDDLIRDSDIEGAEDDDDLPDDKEWGKSSRNYYNTDFVDPDYSSYNAQEEELAKAEEEEAKKIQLRLVKHMTDADFGLDKIAVDKDKNQSSKVETEEIKLKTDLSGMTQSQRLELLQQDSPEFTALTQNFADFLDTVKSLIAPVTLYARENKVPNIPALQFASLYENMLMTFCSNVGFYLLLKAKRSDVKRHPVIKRIVQLKDLLEQLKDKYDNIIAPQLDALLERIKDGDVFQIKVPLAEQPKAKKVKLQIMDEYEKASKKQRLDKSEMQQVPNDLSSDDESADDKDNDVEPEEADGEVDARRGITYQIAKNKGLTPHRKKELRNPRVKHRGKYRKALIRRKGAVRTVRKELQRYGGEVSGIKATVSKSIKFKT